MFRKELIKPVIKNVIQPQSKISIRTAVPYGLRIFRIQFIKMLAPVTVEKEGKGSSHNSVASVFKPDSESDLNSVALFIDICEAAIVS